MKKVQLKLEVFFKECDKHLLRIKSAKNKMSSFIPLTKEKYPKLTEDEIEHIDQLLFRFSKMQDTLGDKIFCNLLLYLDENNAKSIPFIDVLNRLEKLTILEDKSQWLELRKIRNQLAHEYGDDPQLMSEGINLVVDRIDLLDKIYQKIKNYYRSR